MASKAMQQILLQCREVQSKEKEAQYQALEHSNICRSHKEREPAKKTKARHTTGKLGEFDLRKGKPREESVVKRRECSFVSNAAAKMTSNCSKVII